MKNYLDEWKDIQDVYIPQANTIGFQESVIIRDYIPPRETSVFMPEADGTELLRHEDNETELRVMMRPCWHLWHMNRLN